MNLFRKKIAMYSVLAFGGTFLMSFDQKSDDYGQSIQVYSNVKNLNNGEDVAITGLVRVAARYTVGVTRNALRHLTPEMEQASNVATTIFGALNNESVMSEMKNEKLYNLDK